MSAVNAINEPKKHGIRYGKEYFVGDGHSLRSVDKTNVLAEHLGHRHWDSRRNRSIGVSVGLFGSLTSLVRFCLANGLLLCQAEASNFVRQGSFSLALSEAPNFFLESRHPSIMIVSLHWSWFVTGTVAVPCLLAPLHT